MLGFADRVALQTTTHAVYSTTTTRTHGTSTSGACADHGPYLLSLAQQVTHLCSTRDNWAKTVSTNPNVKIYIGAPASSTAGGGYVDAATLSNIALETRSQYSSFGGVMLWDASQAYGASKLPLDSSHRMCSPTLATHSQPTAGSTRVSRTRSARTAMAARPPPP